MGEKSKENMRNLFTGVKKDEQTKSVPETKKEEEARPAPEPSKGRKRGPRKRMNGQIKGFNLSEEVVAAIEAHCDKEDISLSEYARKVFEKDLREKGYDVDRKSL